MSARFRHRHDVRTETVTVTVQPGDGRISETFCAKESEMRRFAWALLADLAPDDIPEPLNDLAEQIVFGACACACGRGAARRAPSGKTGAILEALADGPLSSRVLGQLIERPASNASALIAHLHAAGLVERVNGGGRGVAAIWRITVAGRASLLAAA